jgi:hypothetical protein
MSCELNENINDQIGIDCADLAWGLETLHRISQQDLIA